LIGLFYFEEKNNKFSKLHNAFEFSDRIHRYKFCSKEKENNNERHVTHKEMNRIENNNSFGTNIIG